MFFFFFNFSRFKPQIVKEMIHNILFDQLSSQKYNVDEAKVWSKKIADTIRDKVKGKRAVYIFKY